MSFSIFNMKSLLKSNKETERKYCYLKELELLIKDKEKKCNNDEYMKKVLEIGGIKYDFNGYGHFEAVKKFRERKPLLKFEKIGFGADEELVLSNQVVAKIFTDDVELEMLKIELENLTE